MRLNFLTELHECDYFGAHSVHLKFASHYRIFSEFACLQFRK